jgi:hypothetical protein
MNPRHAGDIPRKIPLFLFEAVFTYIIYLKNIAPVFFCIFSKNFKKKGLMHILLLCQKIAKKLRGKGK